VFNIKAAISHLQQTENLIICLRHGERYGASSIAAGTEIELTPAGKATSKTLGNYLNTKFTNGYGLKSSPIKRCVQTAEILSDCCQQIQPEVILSQTLGAPGPYISNTDTAAKIFAQKSIFEIVQMQCQHLPIPGFHATSVGTEFMCQKILADLTETTRPALYISHDVILAAFIGSLVEGLHLDQNNWPGYLEGFCIFRQQEDLYLQTARTCTRIKTSYKAHN